MKKPTQKQSNKIETFDQSLITNLKTRDQETEEKKRDSINQGSKKNVGKDKKIQEENNIVDLTQDSKPSVGIHSEFDPLLNKKNGSSGDIEQRNVKDSYDKVINEHVNSEKSLSHNISSNIVTSLRNRNDNKEYSFTSPKNKIANPIICSPQEDKKRQDSQINANTNEAEEFSIAQNTSNKSERQSTKKDKTSSSHNHSNRLTNSGNKIKIRLTENDSNKDIYSSNNLYNIDPLLSSQAKIDKKTKAEDNKEERLINNDKLGQENKKEKNADYLDKSEETNQNYSINNNLNYYDTYPNSNINNSKSQESVNSLKLIEVENTKATKSSNIDGFNNDKNISNNLENLNDKNISSIANQGLSILQNTQDNSNLMSKKGLKETGVKGNIFKLNHDYHRALEMSSNIKLPSHQMPSYSLPLNNTNINLMLNGFDVKSLQTHYHYNKLNMNIDKLPNYNTQENQQIYQNFNYTTTPQSRENTQTQFGILNTTNPIGSNMRFDPYSQFYINQVLQKSSINPSNFQEAQNLLEESNNKQVSHNKSSSNSSQTINNISNYNKNYSVDHTYQNNNFNNTINKGIKNQSQQDKNTNSRLQRDNKKGNSKGQFSQIRTPLFSSLPCNSYPNFLPNLGNSLFQGSLNHSIGNMQNFNLYQMALEQEREKEKEKQDEVNIPRIYLYRDNYLDLLLMSFEYLKNKDNLNLALEEYKKEQKDNELQLKEEKERRENVQNSNDLIGPNSYYSLKNEYRHPQMLVNTNNSKKFKAKMKNKPSNTSTKDRIKQLNKPKCNPHTNNFRNGNNHCDSISSCSNSKIKKCESKNCTATDNKKGHKWRWFKVSTIPTKKPITVCNLCFDAYQNKQYCFYCGDIYKDTFYSVAEEEEWIECCQCKNWIHQKCELEKGGNYYDNFLERVKDIDYKCCNCRDKKGMKEKKKKHLLKSNRYAHKDIGNKATLKYGNNSSNKINEYVDQTGVGFITMKNMPTTNDFMSFDFNNHSNHQTPRSQSLQKSNADNNTSLGKKQKQLNHNLSKSHGNSGSQNDRKPIYDYPIKLGGGKILKKTNNADLNTGEREIHQDLNKAMNILKG